MEFLVHIMCSSFQLANTLTSTFHLLFTRVIIIPASPPTPPHGETEGMKVVVISSMAWTVSSRIGTISYSPGTSTFSHPNPNTRSWTQVANLQRYWGRGQSCKRRIKSKNSSWLYNCVLHGQLLDPIYFGYFTYFSLGGPFSSY